MRGIRRSGGRSKSRSSGTYLRADLGIAEFEDPVRRSALTYRAHGLGIEIRPLLGNSSLIVKKMSCFSVFAESVNVQRPRDIFDLLLSQILERERYSAADLIANRPRDADAAGLGERFQARRDFEAVAVNVAVLDHHVAEVNPDAEFEAFIIG